MCLEKALRQGVETRMASGSSCEETVVNVAVGVVTRSTATGCEVLIGRRPDHTVLPGFWELPGGKVEPEESLQDCLMREFREELAIDIEVGPALPVIEHRYDHAHVRLHPFYCRHVGGTPQNLAVVEHRWVTAEELCHYDFPPANVDLIAEVARELREHPPVLP